MPSVAVERSAATRVVGLGAAATLTDSLRRTAARGAALVRLCARATPGCWLNAAIEPILAHGTTGRSAKRHFDYDNHGEEAALLDATDRGPVSGQ